MQKKSDEYWMDLALKHAISAFQQNEVPIAALLVKNDQLIAKAHNKTGQLNNSLAHAEKLVIEEVINSGVKYLYDYTLYVTVEPCLMCAGMIIWSRVGRVVYAAADDKAGAVGSIYNVLLDKSFNHHPKLTFGILEKEAKKLMQDFFAEKRKERTQFAIKR
jgi:tRNA(adenine34) deaminase